MRKGLWHAVMQALKNFRTYFFRGMAALLPTILTIWIFVQCYLFVQNRISIHINRGIVRLILEVTEDRYSQEFLEEFWVYGNGQIAGFVLAIIGVCFIGAFLASFAGRTLWRMVEKGISRIPLVKKVYPYIKQITDFVLAKQKMSFNRVVALQYPRKGVWSVGMVTGAGLRKISESIQREFLTVFVPTSPTPFTGYVIITPKDETIELDMTVEEALRFTISGGVITPAEREAFRAEEIAASLAISRSDWTLKGRSGQTPKSRIATQQALPPSEPKLLLRHHGACASHYASISLGRSRIQRPYCGCQFLPRIFLLPFWLGVPIRFQR